MSQATLERMPVARRLERLMIVALVAGPFAGVLIAAHLLWSRGISGADVVIMAAFYFFTGFGVTVGFHRLLTHGAFDAPRWLRALLAVAGSMSVEGSVIKWVADHRRHHANSDRDGDPHSPHLDEGVWKGLWHAHVGWLFRGEEGHSDPVRWAPDLVRDPVMVRIDRLFPILTLATFLLPGLVGWLWTGNWFTALVWGGLVRIFLLNHATFAINSVCHVFGKRPYASRDMSTNNWALAVITMGESWHNNHHAFPSSAVHGLDRGQVDLSAAVIAGMRKLGLVSNVRRPSEEQKALKRV